MSKSESEILEVLNGLGSKKLDLDILFSYYSLELSFEIRKVIAEKIGMQERKGYFLIEKMIKKITLAIILLSTLIFNVKAEKVNFFDEAKNLYENEKYDDSKFLFQRNIVYNPKDSKSYLYLAKIFKNEENKTELEKNINTVLLLEPNNEEAMYLLIDIELERSNFSKAEELREDFKKICSNLCDKIASINKRLKEFEKKDAS